MQPFKLAAGWALLLNACFVCAPLAAQERDEPAEIRPNIADAAELRQWSKVKAMIEWGVSVNVPQADGMTALHWAAWHDQPREVARLLKERAKADARNRYDVTPLALACENGNAEIVTMLLDAGADANAAGPGGETVLMTASRTGRTGAVRLLLKHGAKVDAVERGGQTALMWAAAEGHQEVVDVLVRAGADINLSLKSGFNALFFAVREGRIDVVDALLKAGADVNQPMRPQSGGGRAPRNGMSPLLLAIENGHFQLAARLLDAGADPNDQRSGFTPLHALTWVRKPNLGDGLDGAPPPIGSGAMTSLELVGELVDHGAKVNARLKRGRSGRGRLNRTGATPFLLAADTADLPLMKRLLEFDADPTIANADDCPPILAAAGIGTMAPGEEAGNEEEAMAAVRFLLQLGADINAVDRNGETAMHGAAYASFPKMIALLDQEGADIKVWYKKNKYGWTPLLIAEGHRPGNFKPAAETIAAVHRLMRDAGMTPPPPTPRKRTNRLYEKKKPPTKNKPKAKP